jgi:hypothetical protein
VIRRGFALVVLCACVAACGESKYYTVVVVYHPDVCARARVDEAIADLPSS